MYQRLLVHCVHLQQKPDFGDSLLGLTIIPMLQGLLEQWSKTQQSLEFAAEHLLNVQERLIKLMHSVRWFVS